jgi:thimet oligopeptidase
MFAKSALAVILSVSMSIAVAASGETARPTIPLWDAEALTQACTTGLVKLGQQVAALEKLPLELSDARSVFGAWNALQIEQEDVEGPVYLLNNVSPDVKVRSAADACLIKYNEFSTTLFQNEALYQHVLAVKPADAIDAKLKKDLLEGFEDTGVSLPAEKRARMKEIHAQLELIRQEFERDIRDNKTRLSFTADEVKGLPHDYLTQAKRDEKGNYLLGFEYPEYVPFMENAVDAAARRRYQFAFTNRGGARNIELLNQVAALRHEMAGLFGLPSYAHFVTRRRMVGKPEVVHKFLGEVMQAVREIEIRDLEDLRQVKAKDLGQPLAEVKLNRWDISYYQERVKQQRFSIDQEALRRYFPAEATLAWVMQISSQLYGIEFRRASSNAPPLWHPEVRYYDVIDTKSGALFGGVYLDLYPREGKFSHAAAFGVRGVSMLGQRTPISVLVTNFNRNGLNFDELETLVHEFGHVMHGMLSRTRYVAHAGTSVETDFVEAPSQMYEEWARRLESVRLIHDFCKDCPAVDAEMMQRLNAARNFGRGVRYSRQHLYASFDMALYAEHPGEALATWQKMEAATPLGYVPGTSFPGQFDHIIRNYGAGYYGYMWSEVLALDMLSQYGDSLMNPAVGRRFRAEILERGGEKSGAELVRAFLGREPSPQAFFAEIRGQRQ